MQRHVIVSSHVEQSTALMHPTATYIPSLDHMVLAWLDAKGTHTHGSWNTRYRYELFMNDFRKTLGQGGLDLDADPGLIATIAQGWASRPLFAEETPLPPSHHHAMGRHSARARAARLEAEGGVSTGTYNGRLCTISSFYTYALKRGWVAMNPINLAEKRKGEDRDYAHPLEKEEVERSLAAIDRSEPIGRRDYALLTLAFTTGRRAAELIALVWGDITFSLRGKATIYWRHCKGGKTMEDELTPLTRDALLDYMHTRFGEDLSEISPEEPLWIIHARNEYHGKRLRQGGLSGIWKRRLGTTKVHTSRHTFALLMEGSGANLSDIGARLGHSNLATTSVYMQRIHRAENPYAQKVAQSIGITAREPDEHGNGKLQEKKERVIAALMAHPERSNSAIARETGVDRTTVRMYRRRMEEK